jgi:hypothetical protein
LEFFQGLWWCWLLSFSFYRLRFCFARDLLMLWWSPRAQQPKKEKEERFFFKYFYCELVWRLTLISLLSLSDQQCICLKRLLRNAAAAAALMHVKLTTAVDIKAG